MTTEIENCAITEAEDMKIVSPPSHTPEKKRPEKYTIKPERKEIAAVSIDLTRHDDFQGPRKLEVSS